jgi:hypothetical protein
MNKNLKFSLGKLMVILLLIFGIYVISSVGVDIIPKFKVGWSEEFVLKLNNVLLNLAYSYIAGLIIYFLISYLPDQIQKKRFQPIVKRDIKRIHHLFLEMVNSMSSKKKQDDYKTIPDYNVFEELMECISPNEKYPNTIGQITEASFLRTFFYLRVETLEIIKHIHLFKKQVPDRIILLLEELTNSNLFKDVIMWNSFKGEIGNQNMKEFAKSFYDGFEIVKKLNDEAEKLY